MVRYHILGVNNIMIDLSKIDSVVIVLFCSSLISLYGLCLFGYEWWRRKKASFIFKSVTILFFGEFIDASIGCYGRLLSTFDKSTYEILRVSYLWTGKYFITTAVMFTICLYMTNKIRQALNDADPTYDALEERKLVALKLLEAQKREASKLLSEQKTVAFKLLKDQKVVAHKLLEDQIKESHNLLESQIYKMFDALKNN